MKLLRLNVFITLFTLSGGVFLSVNALAQSKPHDELLDALSNVKRESVFDQPEILGRLKTEYPNEFSETLWKEMQQATDYRLNQILQKNPDHAEVIEKAYRAKLKLDEKAVPQLLEQAIHDLDSAKSTEARETLLKSLLNFENPPPALLKAALESRPNASVTEKFLAEALAQQGKVSMRTSIETLYPFARQLEAVTDSKTRELILKKLNIDKNQYNAVKQLFPDVPVSASRIKQLQQEFHFALHDLKVMPIADRARFGASYYHLPLQSSASGDWKFVKKRTDAEWLNFFTETHADLDREILKSVHTQAPAEQISNLYHVKFELAGNPFPESLDQSVARISSLKPEYQEAVLKHFDKRTLKVMPESTSKTLEAIAAQENPVTQDLVRNILVHRESELLSQAKISRSQPLADLLINPELNAERFQLWTQLVPEKTKASGLKQMIPALFERNTAIGGEEEIYAKVTQWMRESPELKNELMPTIIDSFAKNKGSKKVVLYFQEPMQNWLRQDPTRIQKFPQSLKAIYEDRLISASTRMKNSEEVLKAMANLKEFSSAEAYAQALSKAQINLRGGTQVSEAARKKLAAQMNQEMLRYLNASLGPNCTAKMLKNLGL